MTVFRYLRFALFGAGCFYLGRFMVNRESLEGILSSGYFGGLALTFVLEWLAKRRSEREIARIDAAMRRAAAELMEARRGPWQ